MDHLAISILPDLALPVLRTEPHACPYLAGRIASELVALAGPEHGPSYQLLMDHGFRRTGDLCYRPHCGGCRECVPIRVPVERFTPSRSQRRVRHRNADIEVNLQPPSLDDEHWLVFQRYQDVQHEQPMLESREDFDHFFGRSNVETIEFAYRLDGRLVGSGIVDVCARCLSSVYFYFDPDVRRRSLGTFSALCEIEACRRRGLPYWYLGYTVAGCPAMSYKRRFRPHELLGADGVWHEP